MEAENEQKRKILVIFGLPGTGKSYLARHLAEDFDALYLNTDSMRDQMNKKSQYDDDTRGRVYDRILEEIVRPDVRESMVIVDGTFDSKTFRYRFNKCSWEQEQYLYYIEMKAADAEVKKRMKEDRTYSESDFSEYQKMKKAFDYMPEEHLVMQSDELELNEMREKVKALFDRKEADTAIN